MLHPFVFKDRRVQMVVPSFPALFAQPPWYKPGDERPALGAVLVDKTPDKQVLVLGPGFFSEQDGAFLLGKGGMGAVIALVGWSLFLSHDLKLCLN